MLIDEKKNLEYGFYLLYLCMYLYIHTFYLFDVNGSHLLQHFWHGWLQQANHAQASTSLCSVYVPKGANKQRPLTHLVYINSEILPCALVSIIEVSMTSAAITRRL